MKRTLSHKITAVFMAAMLLLSTTGISMDVHYCQDQLKGISLLGEAKSCHEKKTKKACHAKKADSSEQKSEHKKDDCCHNESVTLEKSDLDATSPQIGTLDHSDAEDLLPTVVFLPSNGVEGDPILLYEHYKPPLPDKEIMLLYQTFLI